MQKYLTKTELDSLLRVAKQKSVRDFAIVLLSYRHGLRCVELLNLKWDYIDWDKQSLYISRAKGSDSGYHELKPDELKLLKRLKKANEAKKPENRSEFIIAGRQSNQLTTARIRQLCSQLGIKANLSRPFHHHQLRHTCGFDMADNRHINPLTIQRYLGHKDFKSTEIYIREAGRDFKNIASWQKC